MRFTEGASRQCVGLILMLRCKKEGSVDLLFEDADLDEGLEEAEWA